MEGSMKATGKTISGKEELSKDIQIATHILEVLRTAKRMAKAYTLGITARCTMGNGTRV